MITSPTTAVARQGKINMFGDAFHSSTPKKICPGDDCTLLAPDHVEAGGKPTCRRTSIGERYFRHRI
jgi:hypothetical protein